MIYVLILNNDALPSFSLDDFEGECDLAGSLHGQCMVYVLNFAYEILYVAFRFSFRQSSDYSGVRLGKNSKIPTRVFGIFPVPINVGRGIGKLISSCRDSRLDPNILIIFFIVFLKKYYNIINTLC